MLGVIAKLAKLAITKKDGAIIRVVPFHQTIYEPLYDKLVLTSSNTHISVIFSF